MTDRNPSIPGAVIRALGSLVDADAIHEACRVVHVAAHDSAAPDPETGVIPQRSIAEAIEGRVFVRVEIRGSEPVTDGVLIDQATAARFSADDYVEIVGARIVEPFGLAVLEDTAATAEAGRVARDDYPDLDDLVPRSSQRHLLACDPKELARACRVLSAIGCTHVEILAPAERGGPIGLRGEMLAASVVAAILQQPRFTGPSAASMDVSGQQALPLRATLDVDRTNAPGPKSRRKNQD